MLSLMRLPRTFLGLWTLIACGGLILAVVTVGIVAGLSGGGMELVRQRGSIGGIGAVVGLLFMSAVGASVVQSKRHNEELDRRGTHPIDASDP